MDTQATLIATAAQVDACRAAQTSAKFTCPLSASGQLPATHYASAGGMPADDLAALSGLCAITTGEHDPRAVFAAAGLTIINPPR